MSVRLRWFGAAVIVAGATSMGCREPSRSALGGGLCTERAHSNVLWPAEAHAAPADDLEPATTRLRELRAEIETAPFESLPAIAFRAVELGDFDLGVELARRFRAGQESSRGASSLLGATLLARARGRAAVDELEALELLESASNEPAASCNRALAYERYGLVRAAALASRTCPCALARGSEAGIGSATAARAPPELTEADRAEIDALLASGAVSEASTRLRSRAAAWRTFFESEALKSWRVVAAADRKRVAARLLAWAELYREQTGNAQPVRLFEELTALAPAAAAEVGPALDEWLLAGRAILEFRAEETADRLGRARALLRRRLPSLEPSIEAMRINALYHLGRTSEIRAAARALRESLDCHEFAWVCARSWWMQAVSEQADADWESSIRSLHEAIRRYRKLAEADTAGYLLMTVGIAHEAMGENGEAELAYARALRQLAESANRRYRYGVLSIFARFEGRQGRHRLAAALQREAVGLAVDEESADLIVESRTLLAEQLVRGGESDQALETLAELPALVEALPSEGGKRRSRALLDHVRAQALLDVDPAAAVREISGYLEGSDRLGERYYRAESLLLRARARARIGHHEPALADLRAGADEISRQSERLEDRASALALYDQSREVLEQLVATRLATGADPAETLRLVEQMRDRQAVRGFGMRRDPAHFEIPTWRSGAAVCLTEYFSLSGTLVAWTTCGDGRLHQARVEVPRDALRTAASEFRAAAESGDLEALATAAAPLEKWLLEPVGKLLDGAVQWIVVPDALLPSVPFAWLSRRGERLFERRRVMVAPSFSALRAGTRGSDSWRALAVADPELPASEEGRLPRLGAAREEVARLATRFSGTEIRVGKAATWSAVASSSGRFDVLHIAAHLSAESRVPLAARLFLAPEPLRPSGRVAADEIASSDFSRYRLVVLGACSSSDDVPTRISGSLDAARAFLAAGAPAVVGTLWDVPDRELAQAFERFYDRLDETSSPADALRAVWFAAAAAPDEARFVSAVASLQLNETALDAVTEFRKRREAR